MSVDATDEEWSQCQAASKGDERNLLDVNGARSLVAKHTPRTTGLRREQATRYFALKAGEEPFDYAPKSPEHIQIQVAAMRAVRSLPEWSADVEVRGDGWIADTLATRKSVSIAIETQLSAQAFAGTEERNERYWRTGVTPFWLRGGKNITNNFGDGLQARITGVTLDEQIESAERSVISMLHAVGRQVLLANATAAYLKSKKIEYEIIRTGSVPSEISAVISDGSREWPQPILLAELGAHHLPAGHDKDQYRRGREMFAGAPIILRSEAPHIRALKTTSFVINLTDPIRSLSQLDSIVAGKRKWSGKDATENVPGSFAYYTETCARCDTQFLMVPYMILGHPEHPVGYKRKVLNTYSDFERESVALDNLAKAVGLPIGTLYQDYDFSYRYRFNPATHDGVAQSQKCPNCGFKSSPSLVDKDEVASIWDGKEAHFKMLAPVPGKGWGAPVRWIAWRDSGASWSSIVSARKKDRRDLEDAEAARQSNMNMMFAVGRVAQQEHKRWDFLKPYLEVADTIIADRQKKIALGIEKANAAAERKFAGEERQKALRRFASRKIFERSHLDFWLTNPNSGLSEYVSKTVAASPNNAAGQSSAGLEAALEILNTLKMKNGKLS